MAINFRSNTVIKNLRVGPLSGGGNGGGGGGGSSEPSYLAVGAYGVNNSAGAVYVFDATDYTATPTKLEPSGLDASDSFGSPVAATSNYIVVAAQGDDDQGYNAGDVYVYDATNLSATPTKLSPAGLETEDYFGSSVAVYGNHIVVGAYGDDDQGDRAGAVYVYDATNLSATPTKLTPSGLEASDLFGESLAATSNHIIVGARGDDDQGNVAGAVYVYDVSNLSATPTKLAPSGLGEYDNFGKYVAATSDYIVAGAPYDDDQGENAGAVYVYDANNLSATPTKLAPSGLDSTDYFGHSVAVYGNHIVVGAFRDDDQADNAGAVYVYDATNLSATPTKLAPSGLDSTDYFGHSVAVYGNHIVVGAFRDDDQADNAGAVYVYDATNLSATPTKLAPSGLDSTDYFGHSVAVYGNHIVVGAFRDDDQADNAGAVYVYDATNLSATPTKLTAADGSANHYFGTAVSLG